MKLSERLMMNVSLVPRGARVADIGCDHGYSAIWLVENHAVDRVIALDINQGPLERARNHIRRHGLEHEIECRLSNGTEGLVPGEVDTLMIAGMGGPLTIEILSANEPVMKHVSALILQPQSEIGAVRKYLSCHGFSIRKEKACKEDGKYYFAMLAQKEDGTGKKALEDRDFEEWEYRYGPCLIREKNEVLAEYLENEEHTYKRILEKLKRQDSRTHDRKDEVCRLLEEIRKCRETMGVLSEGREGRDGEDTGHGEWTKGNV